MAKVAALGCDLENINEVVIVSPFVSISAVEKRLTSTRAKFQGIFFIKGISGVYRKQKITFISTIPSGDLPADVVMFLKNSPAKRYLFAGSFGALFNTSPGSVFYVNQAFSVESYLGLFEKPKEKRVYKKHLLPEQPLAVTREFKGLKILSTRSLAAEADLEWLQDLQDLGFKGLDMESANFLSSAKLTERSASALLFAADFPLNPNNILSSPKISRQGKALIDNYLDKALEIACISP